MQQLAAEPYRFLLVALERTVVTDDFGPVSLAHPWKAMKACDTYLQPRLALVHIHTRIFTAQGTSRASLSIPISPSSHRSLCCTDIVYVSFQNKTQSSSVVPNSHDDTVSDESEFQMRPIWRFILRNHLCFHESRPCMCRVIEPPHPVINRDLCVHLFTCADFRWPLLSLISGNANISIIGI